MQTRPRSPQADQAELTTDDNGFPSGPVQPRRWRNVAALKKGCEVGLALAGVALAFLYLSRGWSFYDSFPGGRKGLTGLAVAAGLGCAAGRVGAGRPAAGWWPGLARLGQDARLREGLPVGLVLGLALLVRLWGVNFGLPYLEHVDEWNVAERGLHIIQTGSFDPYDYRHPGLAEDDRQAFTYPTFYTYLQSGVFALRFLQGVAANQYEGTSALASPPVKADFYLWGRALTALLGAGTAGLLYVLGKRAFGRPVGLTAALFLTFFYLHALNSHWLTTDVPSGFMALLPFIWIWPVLEGRDERRLYLLAGFTAGLAVATKYNNALIVVPLSLAHLLSRPPQRWLKGGNLPLAGVAMLAGFVAGAPFIWLHFPQFLTDLAAIIEHYQNTGHPGFEGDNNWLRYLGYMLDENSAVVGLGLGGLVLAALRHSRADLVLLSFPLLTYLQLSSYKVNFSRNLMPVIPFVALFAAMFVVTVARTVAERWRWSSRVVAWAIGLVAVLAVVSPTLAIIRYDSYNAQPTNRARATAWIEQNLPHGARLWLEPFSTDLLPRADYRLEGGKGALSNPPEWYAANGFHYLVLSEAYYKEAAESGNAQVRASYQAYTGGPYPAGMSLVQDFKKSTGQPGARILILQTGLPLLTTAAEVSRVAQPLKFDFGETIRLSGWQTAPAARAGAILTVNLYWETLRPPGQNYTTFLHLYDQTGNRVAQVDLPPLAGTRPTSGWKTGEVIRDDYPLALPAALPSGQYRVVAGLYLAPNGPRLTLPGGQNQAEIGLVQVGR